MSAKQNSPFRPRAGRPYRNETEPRIAFELRPDEADAVMAVLQTGYCPYTLRGEFLAGRDRMEQAIRIERGVGGLLDERRAA